jgi:hypothetical protein
LAVRFGPCDQSGAAGQLPFPPWGDDLEIGGERGDAEFEADLVVAFAGGPMGDRIGPGFARDFDQPLGNERSRNRGAEQVIALVTRVGAHHRENEVADEFLAQVVDIDVLGLDPHQHRLGARGLKLAFLAEIGGKRHHLAAVGDLQPLEDDAGVESARIGEDDFLDL